MNKLQLAREKLHKTTFFPKTGESTIDELIPWDFKSIPGIKLISINCKEDRTIFIGEAVQEVTLNKSARPNERTLYLLNGSAKDLTNKVSIPELTVYELPIDKEVSISISKGSLFTLIFKPKL